MTYEEKVKRLIGEYHLSDGTDEKVTFQLWNDGGITVTWRSITFCLSPGAFSEQVEMPVKSEYEEGKTYMIVKGFKEAKHVRDKINKLQEGRDKWN